MSETAEHTPTPFDVLKGSDGIFLTAEDGHIIATFNEWNQEIHGHGDDGATMSFVQRACNAHDSLVEACETLLRWDTGEHTVVELDELNTAVRQARAALANAKKGE